MTDEQQTQAELAQMLRDIAGMCEGDVDAMLQDTLRYPAGPEVDEPLKAACFRRLAELRGEPLSDDEAAAEMDALEGEGRPCPRCEGTGIYAPAKTTADGTCWLCGGSGVAH